MDEKALIENLKQQIDSLNNRLNLVESFVSESRQRGTKVVFNREDTGTITADKTLVLNINGKNYQINAL